MLAVDNARPPTGQTVTGHGMLYEAAGQAVRARKGMTLDGAAAKASRAAAIWASRPAMACW